MGDKLEKNLDGKDNLLDERTYLSNYSGKAGRDHPTCTEELQSPRFLGGLTKAIEITFDTGRETAFEVKFDMNKRIFIYPDVIQIGSTESVGPHTTAFVKEKYTKETGRKPGESWDDFEKWTRDNRLEIWEPYPPFKETEIARSSRTYPLYGNQLSSLIHFHTHSRSFSNCDARLRPSLQDLKALNFTRISNDVKINPVVLTALVNCDKHAILRRIPLFFYQEKGDEPLREEDIGLAYSYFPKNFGAFYKYGTGEYEGGVYFREKLMADFCGFDF